MSLSHSGMPENSSPSHQTLPASSASRSVSDMDGSIFRYIASKDQPQPRAAAEHGIGNERRAGGNRGGAQVDALVGEKDTAADEQQRPEQASGKSRQNEGLS